jgi:hypothetical protein
MKEERFEKTIRSKRTQLDSYEVPDGLWSKIKKESFSTSTGENNIQKLNYWKIAASILLLITSGLLIKLFTIEQSPGSLGDLSPEYKSIELGYLAEIDQMYATLPIDQIDPADFEWLFTELATLDSVQQDYLKDLPNENNREKVIGVLIDHYEKKIKLLKKLELEINRRQHENEISIS